MQSQLQLPLPDNLIARGYRRVEADLYNICERIKEISPRLHLILHERHENAPWVVMERLPDGTETFVARYEIPDGRILEDLRRMLALPLEQRLAKLEQEVEAHNDKLQEWDDETLERLAWEARRALVKDGISDGVV